MTAVKAALESLGQIKSIEPPLLVVPKQEISQAFRVALQHLFPTLTLHAPKSPCDKLLIEGFDAEQIGQQVDLQFQPLLPSLRRKVKKFEKHPEEISKLKQAVEGGHKKVLAQNETDNIDDDDDDDDDMDEVDDEDNDDIDEVDDEKEKDEEDEEEKEEEEKGAIEDKFLKIKELQDYLEEDEAREFGLKDKKKTKRETKNDETELEDDEGEQDDDDEEDELGLFDGEDDEDGNARYEDFFSSGKNKGPKRKDKFRDSLEGDSASDDDQDQDVDKRKDGLSTHEKELDQVRSKIEQMEKANLDPKVWTMCGEVTAAQRQKNSALEVDLDFEHNVRPAPVITEEVTASLEDLIKTRISEGLFDDVRKAPTLSSQAPRKRKELDDNKSKKGLAEVYEDEFVQKTDPAFAPLTFSDELKKEASMLFKKLCLKLDALSHFHFTPKPVVEDMSIQTNVLPLPWKRLHQWLCQMQLC